MLFIARIESRRELERFGANVNEFVFDDSVITNE